jgi:hypothetical protein
MIVLEVVAEGTIGGVGHGVCAQRSRDADKSSRLGERRRALGRVGRASTRDGAVIVRVDDPEQ